MLGKRLVGLVFRVRVSVYCSNWEYCYGFFNIRPTLLLTSHDVFDSRRQILRSHDVRCTDNDDLLRWFINELIARAVTSVSGCDERFPRSHCDGSSNQHRNRLKTEHRATSTKPRDRRLCGARRRCHLANARRTPTPTACRTQATCYFRHWSNRSPAEIRRISTTDTR